MKAPEIPNLIKALKEIGQDLKLETDEIKSLIITFLADKTYIELIYFDSVFEVLYKLEINAKTTIDIEIK